MELTVVILEVTVLVGVTGTILVTLFLVRLGVVVTLGSYFLVGAGGALTVTTDLISYFFYT